MRRFRRGATAFIAGVAVALAGIAFGGGAANASVLPFDRASVNAALATSGCAYEPEFYLAGSSSRVGILPADTALSKRCILRIGDKSGGVLALQEALNSCHGEHLTLDNIYGPATEAAVKRRQAAAGITQDGIYGPVTMTKTKFVIWAYTFQTSYGCAFGSSYEDEGWWPGP